MLSPAKSPEMRLGLIDAMRAHIEAGCSEVLSDQPVNHFAAALKQAETAAPPILEAAMQEAPQAEITTARSQPSETPSAPATMPVVPNSDEPAAGAADAQNLAAAVDSLSALSQAMQDFEGCALKKTAKNTVFSDGVEGAPVMIVGEAPGADEDRAGKPFVGRSGQLLDAMLRAIGLSREENVYIANTIAWRPIGNRTPTPEEIALCKPVICRQIELSQPKLLLFVGNVSSKTLLATKTGITRLRGTWHDYRLNEIEIPAMPLLHPAYLLRRPEMKKEFWADLCAVRERLTNIK